MKKNPTVTGVAEALSAKEYSAHEFCTDLLKKINSQDREIGAFLAINEEKVLSDARDADRRRATGSQLSAFDGIPVAVKDCIAEKEMQCTCGSKLLESFVSPYDATAVAKLRKFGFIPFGRLNMDEFAMGSSCENSAYRKTVNPRDHSRVPGGSSGGSAASVAAGLVPAALGSDTGGSIRQPAAFCGIVGLKPTYGRVSRYGLVAFASSLDQIGPLTNSVKDAALLLDVISGHDPADSTSLPHAATNVFEELSKNGDSRSLHNVRIGVPSQFFSNGSVSPRVEKKLQNAIDMLKQAGAQLVDVDLPHTKYAIATYYIIATAEASANLARFDGIRYGDRVESINLVETYFKTRGAGFGDEVKRRILLGTYVLSSGYYDAYYLRAQKVRTLIRRDFENAYKQCDVMFLPTTPDVAFEFGAKSDPLQMYFQDIFTISLNLAGHCGINLPIGNDDETGMPVGAQLWGPAMGEAALLKTAHIIEQLNK